MYHVIKICSSAALTALIFLLPYPAHAATCKYGPKLCDGLETSSQDEADLNKNRSLPTTASQGGPQSPAATQKSNALLPSVNQGLADPDDFVFVPQVQSARACSPLSWNEDRIIEVPRSPTDPGDYGASGGVDDPIGIIQPPPDADEVALTDGLVLEAVDAGSVVSTILNPPYALANARLIGDLPGNLIFDYYDGRVAIFTPCRNGMPTRLTHPARSKRFTIRLTPANSNAPVEDYQVTLPVNLKIYSLIRVIRSDQTVNVILEASGGPLECSSVPTSVACGPIAWNYLPGLGGPLPGGLALDTVANESGRLHGTVAPDAYSSSGVLRVTQGGETYDATALFEVPVSFSDADLRALEGVREIEREIAYEFPLPQPRGGDGAQYNWEIVYGSPRLPLGLHIDDVAPSIEGTVARAAAIGSRTVELKVSSALAHPAIQYRSATASMSFRLTVPFNVWTQNAQLRPNNLLPLNTWQVAALSYYFPAIGAAEIIFDYFVKNSADDNRERTDRILDRLDHFDIIALQEVFDEDNESQLRSGAERDYHVAFGPPGKGPVVPLPWKPWKAKLPEGASGLALLVSRDLEVPCSEHYAEVFDDCNGDLVDIVAGAVTFRELNSDCLAQKGFTLDTIELDSDPESFIYVVNTHLDAGSSSGDATARENQLLQIIAAVRDLTEPSHPVVLMGDFNIEAPLSPPGDCTGPTTSAEYDNLCATLGAIDMYRLQHTVASRGEWVGFTIDNQVNAYGYNWSDGDDRIEQMRIDYVLVIQGEEFEIELDDSVSRTIIVQDNANLPENNSNFDTRLCRDPGSRPRETGWLVDNPSLRCYLSDHWGLEAHLRLVKP